jgi:hypothetical protein
VQPIGPALAGTILIEGSGLIVADDGRAELGATCLDCDKSSRERGTSEP